MSPVGDIMLDMKDKAQTKARIVSAVGELIAEGGFSKVGVNAVARQAGVDKVLIYRYFNGLEGLHQAYAKSEKFWPTIDELLGSDSERTELIDQGYVVALSEFFKRYTAALRSRPLTLEVLAWEAVERNALTIALEQAREAFGLEVASHLQALELPEADWLAISNIFTSSIHYLAIRGRKITHFTGMSLGEDESWARLLDSMEYLIRSTAKSPA